MGSHGSSQAQTRIANSGCHAWNGKIVRRQVVTNDELLETLQDARAYHEKDYQWEKQRLGNGGSSIAMGQHRRYADAIAIAAIKLGEVFNRRDER
jgi:hypothetical protein